VNTKRALIIGIGGMDGSHLAEFLLNNNYEVFGTKRSESINHDSNLAQIEHKLTVLRGDILDQASLVNCINQSCPDEIYNLAAQSFLEDCWTSPDINANIIGVGVLRLLEAIKLCDKNIKLFQAGSSEMFGTIEADAATETTPFQPRTPYGAAKVYAFWLCQHYKACYDMFICNGILFNHESERRKIQFLTRKITHGVAKIVLGIENTLSIGNLDSARDWGYAPDFVKGMWSMLQAPSPDDYVLSTGHLKTVAQLLDEAFSAIGVPDWTSYVSVNNAFFRPSEVTPFKGDFSKAKTLLNWQPTTTFSQMIHKMVMNDIKLLKSQIN
jgi:GDPmannose 4,6-dehydratase